VRILVVEDDHHKLRQLRVFLSEIIEGLSLLEAGSVASGKDLIRQGMFDLVVLDMSLPSYDIDMDRHEPGGTPQPFGGRELLGYLDFRGLDTPVVVVTQFERFNPGPEEVGIESLGQQLEQQYQVNFRDIVYFNTASDAWKSSLQRAIEGIK
jgi:CheY-like chemotaxis protein